MIITGADLPELGWQHTEPFNPAAIDPATNNGWIKPAGGLWTSPLRDGVTGWAQWCREEQWGTPDAPVTRILPNPGARVYVIDTLADLVQLEAAFPSADSSLPAEIKMWPQIDWQAVASEYDAIWLTEEGQWRTRHSTPSLYGWDCETVLWLNPCVTAIGATVSREI